MKNKSISNKNLIFIIVAIVIFLFVLKDIFQYEVTSYDNWAYNAFVENLRSNNMTIIMKIITSFGSMLVICIILLILMFLYKNKKIIYLIMINTVSIVIINDFLKFLIHRPRPSGYRLITESNYSFPSGHSMISTLFYGFIIYIVYNEIKNKKLKYFLIILLSILIIAICISRVYLGVHYLSDTIAGFSLSLVYLIIFISYNKTFRKEINHGR
jgi:undecaprenyl-diphosphatase